MQAKTRAEKSRIWASRWNFSRQISFDPLTQAAARNILAP